MNRKAETFALVAELWARRFSRVDIGLVLDLSPSYVSRIITLLRLEPPAFEGLAEALTWLASQCPDIELRARWFRNGTQSQAEEKEAA